MITSRRSFFLGAGATLLAAPSIVRVAASLMPVSTAHVPTRTSLALLGMGHDDPVVYQAFNAAVAHLRGSAQTEEHRLLVVGALSDTFRSLVERNLRAAFDAAFDDVYNL